ncbi:MAG: 4-hydroxy-3-methylbut-2-enyl diphosphate reductase [Pseudomonadota bacterium]|jgi:4-hydroxy-3-methylbut-2-enyl diphosphate reductase|nr:4-hydroxy-3-methylbut-2-enyl diphosphate reductase [Pseudomonadota bacterium]NLX31703.1 4-hydroxy-3-methylbut-2-enyl diphosphate reductase [Deltaproteobacteria bacterium]HNU84895.1 4-hydroxy-3-methylbut-2-enyl diphosphate reductase [Syntrophales bacterium]HNZ34276.1 4-hydroxy-3-methylbut-2-enyl diphosphate reductase [Syntrophales bacterium]HOH44450.1 4-hydroxy-3-methylbut-2-enyl diphosphate reductase [Syntrophales bacterium]
MDIEIADGSGFCFGVRRAVNLALRAAEDHGRRTVTLGPLVHNPLVVERLEAKGIRAVEEVAGDADVVVLRAHGTPAPQEESLRRRRLEIVDATCPFVKRAQRHARALREEGYQVVILGDRAHPEVASVRSYAGDDAVVVESADDLPVALGPRVGVMAQTTQPEEAFLRLVRRLAPGAAEVRVVNTVCRSTAARRAETEKLASRVQVMIVLGGRRSHNTRELARVSRLAGVDTHHIERARELQRQWFRNVGHVGVAAGASTPDEAIEDVVRRIRSFEEPFVSDGPAFSRPGGSGTPSPPLA